MAQGYAWVYRKYSKDAELLELEAEAKREKRGLWADPNPIPPWEWQRGSEMTTFLPGRVCRLRAVRL